jgi:predicted N-formylglutamate amidohydrolase
MARETKTLISCEHAGNEVPKPYAYLFENRRELLNTHRGYDISALPLAQKLAYHCQASLYYNTITRLLVDLNRSLSHRNLFSFLTRALPSQTKQELIQTWYQPYRNSIQEQIAEWIQNKYQVLHIGVHSFTPEWNGKIRDADIGLLYDPKRSCEKEFCRAWKQLMVQYNPTVRVRMNYPYRGIDDGFIPLLRTQFPTGYLGIELEVNQANIDRLQDCILHLPPLPQ